MIEHPEEEVLHILNVITGQIIPYFKGPDRRRTINLEMAASQSLNDINLV